MNHGMRLLSALADVVVVASLLFLVPVPLALAFDTWSATYAGFAFPPAALAYLAASLIATLVWLPIKVLARGQKTDLHEREAYLLVGVAWFLVAVLAAIPFVLSGTLTHPADALFEAMSGVTATGASTIAIPESVAPSILLYRALLQFVGGLGIIVLSVALLARLTHAGARLLSEAGGGVSRLRPKVGQTARALWRIYASFAGVLFVLLLFIFVFDVGLSWKEATFEALVHAMTAVSTAGFTTHSTNIAFFDSGILEGVLVAFMLLSGMNYSLHHRLWHGDWRRMTRDTEWRTYLGLVLVVSAGFTVTLLRAGSSAADALRHALFTTVSFVTSTGYVITDTDAWSQTSKLVLLSLMFIGASAGSTAGGIKILRILVLAKVVRREIRRLLHPRAIISIRHDGRIVPEQSVFTVVAFFFAFLTTWLAGTMALILLDPALGLFGGAVAAAAAIGNTGPALGIVGTTETFAALQSSSRLVLTALMYVGRLEIFTALLVVHPTSWKT